MPASQWIPLVWCVLGLAGIASLGRLLCSVFAGVPRHRLWNDQGGRLGFGFLVGSVVIGLQMLVAGYAGVPFSRGLAVGVWALPTLACVLLLRARGSVSGGKANHSVTTVSSPGLAATGWHRAAMFCAAVALGGYVIALAWTTVSYGASFPDAHAIWLLKARVFFQDLGFSGVYWSDWPESHDRRGYPPGVPLLVTWLYLLIGSADSQAEKLLWVAFLVATSGVIGSALRRCDRPRWALVAVVLTLACPQSVLLTLWGTADLPLAAYTLGAVVVAVDWLSRSKPARPPWLVGVLLCGAVLSKAEGAVLLLSVPGAALLGAWLDRRGASALQVVGGPGKCVSSGMGAQARALLTVCSLPACALASWHIYLGLRGIKVVPFMPAGAASSGGVHERLGLVIEAAGKQFAAPSWLYIWPLATAAAVFAVWLGLRGRLDRPGWAALICSVVVACQLGAYACVWLAFRGDLAYFLSTTVARIPYHVWPTALLGLMYFVARAAPMTCDREP